MERRVQPELLDALPPADPAGRRSRRDLQWINRLMGTAGILRRAVARSLQSRSEGSLRVAELGSGDATLAARVWTRLPRPPQGSVLELMDRWAVANTSALDQLRAHGWAPQAVVQEVAGWLALPEPPRTDLVYTNLFLHHLTPAELPGTLSRIAARTASAVFIEPRRSRFALFGARCLGLLGCDPVTRTDAVRSVHAGFRGRELTSLWPGAEGWSVHEAAAGLFAHRFEARRRMSA